MYIVTIREKGEDNPLLERECDCALGAFGSAGYAALFELMFKFKLAYADEPRAVRTMDERGNAEYKTFDRFDFLQQDASGEWYWNDAFGATATA